eukprot:CAMPEP_0177745280 /NCGR_PEP_ID=MMETSP0484_2-20121128/30229_1 /TAXON_ID=354590 /ORGANISM="Rhodomonas lens, Strain RHODO" /LENGTH=339 /DNA_ID=CAMNT_0019259907 /DNA_START=40 /DNA_END=1057 /DNA_ORIENTATION=+
MQGKGNGCPNSACLCSLMIRTHRAALKPEHAHPQVQVHVARREFLVAGAAADGASVRHEVVGLVVVHPHPLCDLVGVVDRGHAADALGAARVAVAQRVRDRLDLVRRVVHLVLQHEVVDGAAGALQSGVTDEVEVEKRFGDDLRVDDEACREVARAVSGILALRHEASLVALLAHHVGDRRRIPEDEDGLGRALVDLGEVGDETLDHPMEVFVLHAADLHAAAARLVSADVSMPPAVHKRGAASTEGWRDPGLGCDTSMPTTIVLHFHGMVTAQLTEAGRTLKSSPWFTAEFGVNLEHHALHVREDEFALVLCGGESLLCVAARGGDAKDHVPNALDLG